MSEMRSCRSPDPRPDGTSACASGPIHAIGAARNDDADRRLLRQHGADLHRRRMRAEEHARAVLLRLKKKVSCISRAGWSGGKLSLPKLRSSVSISGPSAMAKPISAKIAVNSSTTWLIGWMRPVSAGASRTGSVTSSLSVLSRASSAASLRTRLRSGSPR